MLKSYVGKPFKYIQFTSIVIISIISLIILLFASFGSSIGGGILSSSIHEDTEIQKREKQIEKIKDIGKIIIGYMCITLLYTILFVKLPEFLYYKYVVNTTAL